jgi:hypothetical protein
MFKSKEMRIIHLENRIELMKGRAGRENGRVIRKCERQLRSLRAGD